MKVLLDVFSGLPNPCWDLTSAQAAELPSLLASLTETACTTLPPDGLGYRGMVVSEIEDIAAGYSRIVVCSGSVWADRGGVTLQFSDKGRFLEGWLFRTGKRWLDPGLYREIAGQAGLDAE